MSLDTVKDIVSKLNKIIPKDYHFDKRKIKEQLSIELDNKLNELGKIKSAIDIMYICRKV